MAVAQQKVSIRRLVSQVWFWQIILALAVVTVVPFVLGYIGLAQYVPHQPASAGYGDSWDNILYYDLQLYAFASAPAADPGPFPLWLEIARFLAPLGTLLAALSALFVVARQAGRFTFAPQAPRVDAVVLGDDIIALTLARNLSEREGKYVALVSTSDDTLAPALQHGMLTVRGHPSDWATLYAAGVPWANELWACTSQGTVNAAIALRAHKVRQAAKRPLAAYALVRDTELGVALRARRIGMGGDPRLRLDFFAIEDIAARKLLDVHR